MVVHKNTLWPNRHSVHTPGFPFQEHSGLHKARHLPVSHAPGPVCWVGGGGREGAPPEDLCTPTRREQPTVWGAVGASEEASCRVLGNIREEGECVGGEVGGRLGLERG